MGKGAPKQTPIIIAPEPPAPATVKIPDEISTAEQKRRANISDTKTKQASSLLGASLDSDTQSLLKKSILGV